MKEIKAVVQRFMADQVVDRLRQLPHLPGFTVAKVGGYSRSDHGPQSQERGEEAKMMKIEIVVPDDLAETVVEAIRQAAHTGRSGDGKIFISEVADVLKIRTGERGPAAI